MIFYVGLHHPPHAQHFEYAMISINRLRERRSHFPVNRWLLDSGAFTELSTYGHYRHDVAEYAEQVNRWARCGEMQAAVSQDYMCEAFIVHKTGLTVEAHQALTIDRYTQLRSLVSAPLMPVLQGYYPMDYMAHVQAYGPLLTQGMWVGVGSVCKRNTRPHEIAAILGAIKLVRPDLRLHGFGLKTTALRTPYIRALLYSADSMAWSFAARREGRDANSWEEAKRFEQAIVGVAA